MNKVKRMTKKQKILLEENIELLDGKINLTQHAAIQKWCEQLFQICSLSPGVCRKIIQYFNKMLQIISVGIISVGIISKESIATELIFLNMMYGLLN